MCQTMLTPGLLSSRTYALRMLIAHLMVVKAHCPTCKQMGRIWAEVGAALRTGFCSMIGQGISSELVNLHLTCNCLQQLTWLDCVRAAPSSDMSERRFLAEASLSKLGGLTSSGTLSTAKLQTQFMERTISKGSLEGQDNKIHNISKDTGKHTRARTHTCTER